MQTLYFPRAIGLIVDMLHGAAAAVAEIRTRRCAAPRRGFDDPDDAATLAITVNNVNEAPTVTLSGAITDLDEDVDTSSAIKVADIVVSDDALGVNTLALAGAGRRSWEIGLPIGDPRERGVDGAPDAWMSAVVEVGEVQIERALLGRGAHRLALEERDARRVPGGVVVAPSPPRVVG